MDRRVFTRAFIVVGAAASSCISRTGGSSETNDATALVHGLIGTVDARDLPGVRTALKAARFQAPIDPTIQPQSDFDPEVD